MKIKTEEKKTVGRPDSLLGCRSERLYSVIPNEMEVFYNDGRLRVWHVTEHSWG